MSWINRLAGLIRPRKARWPNWTMRCAFTSNRALRQYLAEGMTPGAARRRARLAFRLVRSREGKSAAKADVIHWLDTAWRDPAIRPTYSAREPAIHRHRGLCRWHSASARITAVFSLL